MAENQKNTKNDPKNAKKIKNKWCFCENYQKKLIFEFAEDYKNFLSENKTERECTRTFSKIAQENGFVNLKDAIANNKKLSAGDKVFCVNNDKSIMLCVLGKDDFESGLNIIGAHIDSPRIDVKATPLYEKDGFCYFDTHYYGGIRSYQWLALPLAIHGVVVKKDGSKIDLNIGEKDDDPVFYISDLLPHLKKPNEKEVVSGEQLDLLLANMSTFENGKTVVSENLKDIFEKMGIEEDDFLSSELEIVPAGKAKDAGFDRSTIVGYGHDDRSCAYVSFKAILNLKTPKKTAVCLLVDKEEIGNSGATSITSKFFENTLAEIMNLAGKYSELNLKRTLQNSDMISSDVTAAFDPSWADSFNPNSDAYLSAGVNFNKYTGPRGKTGGNDANAEFIAKIRALLDENQIFYQFTEMGKVDQGGGSTIAHVLAEYGMNVIDAGIPLLSMHATYELLSKLDLYHTYLFSKCFFEN